MIAPHDALAVLLSACVPAGFIALACFARACERRALRVRPFRVVRRPGDWSRRP